jgi:hypothetical protein
MIEPYPTPVDQRPSHVQTVTILRRIGWSVFLRIKLAILFWKNGPQGMQVKEWHVFVHVLDNDKENMADAPGAKGRLSLTSEQLRNPFPDTFEEMCLRIDSMPGAYCEPDGSVGWNPPGFQGEQLGGTLHCIDERVMCVELFSSLGEENWKRLIDTISSNCPDVAVQLAEEGVFLSREGFRLRAYETD